MATDEIALAECLNANDGVVYKYEYVYQLFSDLMGVMPELNGALSGFDVAMGNWFRSRFKMPLTVP